MAKKLTDTAIRTAKPKEKPYKMADGDGLYVLVNPGGGKLWRLKYRFRECPAYILLYQFSPKDTGQSKVK